MNYPAASRRGIRRTPTVELCAKPCTPYQLLVLWHIWRLCLRCHVSLPYLHNNHQSKTRLPRVVSLLQGVVGIFLVRWYSSTFWLFVSDFELELTEPKNVHGHCLFLFLKSKLNSVSLSPIKHFSNFGQPHRLILLADILLDKQNDTARLIHYVIYGCMYFHAYSNLINLRCKLRGTNPREIRLFFKNNVMFNGICYLENILFILTLQIISVLFLELS